MREAIIFPPPVRDEWHRYTGQERTPPPARWNRAVKGVVLSALRQLESGCKQNEYGKYLASLVNYFTEKQAKSDKYCWYDYRVEDCLTLFPSKKFILSIERHPDFCAVVVRNAKKNQPVVSRAQGTVIEYALLKAYWHMQPD